MPRRLPDSNALTSIILRHRLLLLLGAGSAVASIILGFFVFTPDTLGSYIFSAGYWIMGVTVLLALVALVRLLGLSNRLSKVQIGVILRSALVVFPAWIFIIEGDEPDYKVLMDEPVLQATAFHMHELHQVGTTALAFYAGEELKTHTRFLDKRPYAYSFVLSQFHEVFGYRESNAFALNRLCLGLFLICVFTLAYRMAGLPGGMLAIALLCTLPLLSQTANSAGMEMFNLAALSLTVLLASLWLERPSPIRLDALCLSTVILAQSRYESAAYVLAVAGLIVLAWWRLRRPVVSVGLFLTPWLLIPCAWLHRFVAAQPMLWELNEGQTSRFDPSYFMENARGGWTYLSNLTTEFPNSPLLFFLGIVSLVVLAAYLYRASFRPVRAVFAQSYILPARPAAFAVLTGFGLIVLLNLLSLQFYYWARLDDYLACRFSLPFMWWLVFACVGALSLPLPRSRLVWLSVFAAIVLALGLHTLPTRGERVYTLRNLVTQEIAWERKLVAALPIPKNRVLLLANKSAMPWILQGIPALDLPLTAVQWADLRANVVSGILPHLLVSQRLTRVSPEAPWLLSPEDEIPPEWEFRELGHTAIGVRLIRLGELVLKPSPAPASANQAGASAEPPDSLNRE